MHGLLLTGPTGVGKSTAQTVLREQHGFWTPRTCTTRVVEPNESDLLHFSEPEFVAAVRAGDVVLPASFGDEWYGWLRVELTALQHDAGRAVLNVRPYAALMLQALLSGFVAVWLTVDSTELARRRSARLAARDTDHLLRQRRQAQDEEDLIYEPCFANIRIADGALVASLLDLVP